MGAKVQIRHPVTNRWVKLDKRTGRIVSVKKTPGPYRNIEHHSAHVLEMVAR